MERLIADNFRLEVSEWLERAHGNLVDRSTLASMTIAVDDQIASEVEDIFVKTVRPTFRSSAYDLAVWLVTNWWRLRWEPEANSTDWRLSHDVAATGGGYAWPSLTFISDGQHVLIRNRQTEPKPYEPVRFLRQIDRSVTAEEFERVVDTFIESVLARLSAIGCRDTDLFYLNYELTAERRDGEVGEWRKLEALMGFDPDEAPEEMVATLRRERVKSGQSAIEEVAAACRTSTLDDLRNVLGELEKGQLTISAASIAGEIDTPDFSADSALLPWQQGSLAARQARQAWGIHEGPVKNTALADLLGFPSEIMSVTEQTETERPARLLGAGWRDGEGDRVPIVFRSRIKQNRRFKLMRLVADYTIATFTGDHLLPIRRGGTFRQKYQRAFAAEFLCPYSELEELLPSRPDEIDIEIAANTYDVSLQLITTMLVAKGRLPRQALLT